MAIKSGPKQKPTSSSHKVNNEIIGYIRHHDADQGAYQTFFDACRPTIRASVTSYKNRVRWLEVEEIEQQLNLITLESIQSYKPAQGKFNFFGHLNMRIWQQMTRYLCSNLRPVRLPHGRIKQAYLNDHYLDAPQYQED